MAWASGWTSGAFARGLRSPNPLEELNRYIQAQLWFEGIVMSVVFFEAWGKKRLRQSFEAKEMVLPSLLEDARVGRLIPTLKELGVVSEETSRKMIEVNSWRVKLVHDLKVEYDLSPAKAKEILELAREVMSELMLSKSHAT